ncbi:MAG: hypothetical protein HKN47_14070 [Pirellulaceae bacterium]|nr:hypothetical protein [Pirellulaceae bacterium]
MTQVRVPGTKKIAATHKANARFIHSNGHTLGRRDRPRLAADSGGAVGGVYGLTGFVTDDVQQQIATADDFHRWQIDAKTLQRLKYPFGAIVSNSTAERF